MLALLGQDPLFSQEVVTLIRTAGSGIWYSLAVLMIHHQLQSLKKYFGGNKLFSVISLVGSKEQDESEQA